MVVTTSRSGRSLAGRLALTTFVGVAVAGTVVSVTALVGVYRFARSEVDQRLLAYRQTISSEITGHLQAAGEALSGLAEAQTEKPQGSRNLARGYATTAQYFEQLAHIDPSGAVLTYPDPGLPESVVEKAEEASAALRARPVYAADSSGGKARLWVLRSTEASPNPGVLVARVRLDFLQLALDNVSSAGAERTAIVFDGSTRVPVVVGRDGPSLDHARGKFAADPESAGGRFTLDDSGRGSYVGYFDVVTKFEGLDWVVLVAQPTMGVLRETIVALVPAALALIVASAVAVMFGLIAARRLVAPLRFLGARAAEAASGAYVKPISIRREDEVGRLAESFNAVALRLNALHDVTQLLASSQQLDQVLDDIVSGTWHIVVTGRVSVWLVDEGGNSASLARTSQDDARRVTQVSLKTRSWLREALAADGPVCFSEGEHAGGGSEDAAHSGAGVAIPLAVGSDRLGVLEVSTRDPLGDPEIEMLRTFAAQAAIAIRQSRLFELEQTSRLEAEALRDIAERVADPSEFGDAFDDAAEMAVELLGADGGGVAIVDRGGLALPPHRDPGREAVWLEAFASVGEQASSDVVPIVVEDTSMLPASAEVRALGAISAVLVPLLVESKVRGVLYLEYAESPGMLDRQSLMLAATIGRQLSLALENVSLLLQAQARASSLETVFRIAQAVSSSLQTSVVLNRVLDVVQKIFSADAVSLMTYESTRRVIVTAMARGLVNAPMLHLEVRPGQDIPGTVFETRRPMRCGTLSAERWSLAGVASSQGLESLMSVPLLARGRSIGVLTVFAQNPSAFSPDDMELLSTFATQAALAIDTANMYGREHTVASVLKASILPEQLPSVEGLDSSSVYVAAGSEAEIGGDYCDLFEIGGGKVAIAIGDVCGKGVQAATKTSMLKYTLRGLASAGLQPSACISEVNRAVNESGAPSDIVTLWAGVLDLATGVLTYSNGGHPPGLLFRADKKTVERLETTGPLLGAMADPPFEQVILHMDPGDTLLLYTDGVSEARRGNKFFGEGRVRKALCGGGSASAVAQRLLAAVHRFSPGGLRDDAAVLVVRLVGVGEPAPSRAAEAPMEAL